MTWITSGGEITSPLEQNGSVSTTLQDQTTLALDLKFIQASNQTTLTADADVGDTVISVASASGFIAGKRVGLFMGTGEFYFGDVISVNVLDITLDTPLDRAYGSGATAIASTNHMNVLGSLASPEVFQIGPIGVAVDVDIDITRIMGIITDAGAMDDGKFGSLNALTNGIVLRQNNGVMSNIWNVKTNGDLALISFDASYTDKAPAGENGFRFRSTYAGQNKHGVAIRLEAGDTLELLVQDDLTTLTDFQMMAQGHVVTD